jgi:hypothetical protein
MKTRFLSIIAVLGLLSVSQVASRATNLVVNGSFEEFLPGWEAAPPGYDYRVNVQSPDGTRHIGLFTKLWQDLATQPGETYHISFAANQNSGQVSFGGEVLALQKPTPLPPGILWYRVNAFATATSAVTRLLFEGSTYIDDVRVVSVNTPLQIITQPESRSSLVGGSVAFTVVAEGGAPIRYAWLRDGDIIPGATNATLFLTNLQIGASGNYAVWVSNQVSAVLSSNASLTVEVPPKAPVIVAQPSGDVFPEGYSYALSVVAIGDPPLEYQWSLGGVDMPGATNSALTFFPIQASNSGVYQVVVRNPVGTVQSLPATVVVTNAVGGGNIRFSNYAPTNRQPFYDVDGITRLSGNAFLAQMYAGPSPTGLRPVSARMPFSTGPLAGFFISTTVVVPDVPPGQPAYAQTRVWGSAAGVTYEDARARGGRFAAGPVYSIVTVPTPNLPHSLPMVSLTLQAGLPQFTTGKLAVGSRPPGQPVQWKLTGAPGFAYLIEKRNPPANWYPWQIVTNITGTVLFSDSNNAPHAINFYRSRMLD